MKIDWSSEYLELDESPFTMTALASVARVHFIFTMVGISQLFVVDDGRLVGLITKSSFIKYKKEDPPAHIDGDHQPEAGAIVYQFN